MTLSCPQACAACLRVPDAKGDDEPTAVLAPWFVRTNSREEATAWLLDDSRTGPLFVNANPPFKFNYLVRPGWVGLPLRDSTAPLVASSCGLTVRSFRRDSFKDHAFTLSMRTPTVVTHSKIGCVSHSHAPRLCVSNMCPCTHTRTHALTHSRTHALTHSRTRAPTAAGLTISACSCRTRATRATSTASTCSCTMSASPHRRRTMRTS